MSLDDDLRSAFSQQAAIRLAPPPDPDGLMSGGRARRRRRDLRRAGAGAAAAVLTLAGGYAVVDAVRAAPDDAVASRPSGSVPAVPPEEGDRRRLAPSTYVVRVGTSAHGGRIEAAFTLESANWSDGDFLLASERSESAFAGVGVYQPDALASGTGCVNDPSTTEPAPKGAALARQLTRLPRSTVLEAPAPVRAYGRDAIHLRLRIGVECPWYYRLARTSVGDRGITYTAMGAAAKDVLIDFWVLDVAGAVVVVDQWHNLDASSELVAEVARARASIELTVAR
jgi:hypothetical protein